MKCSIIQDLLPLYCDDLASDDSREEIEKHLAGCEECRKVYENMKTKEMNINIPERDISPLKTVKKQNRLKIIGAVLCTAAVLSGIFMFVFWGVVPITSDRVHYTVDAREKEREEHYSDADSPEESESANQWTETVTVKSMWLNFETDASCCRFSTKPKYTYNSDGSITMKEHLYIYPEIKLPFDDRGKHPNQFNLGFDVHEGDTLIIHYRDKTETIDLYQLYSENAEN
ncbi:MAG: zf-HC2 domain-containing protein [Oscillospiraceae bacterium]|nr:zf-HC2 domain-containing protein [Oscillospiraceae bacterium]